MDERPLTVSALTARIAADLEAFGPVEVQGELTQVKVAPSGHFYATLKDPEAIIPVVMWRSTALRQGKQPREGDRVVVKGSLSVYAPRGNYQLIATRITAAGEGDILARLARLKEQLAAEGLFDEDRKRPLPFLPRAVGIATAGGSAALADLLHAIRERFPTMAIVHAPCLVQGESAPREIVAALGRLERHPKVDVIICGRGGGSMEDLMAFNDVAVVRAIAACSVPTISAVGHETDWTLADLAADIRAKTPTAAGELVVPVLDDLRAELDEGRERLDRAMRRQVDDLRARLAALAGHRALAGPQYQVQVRRQRLDELAGRLETAVGGSLGSLVERTTAAGHRLAVRDPGTRVAYLAERVRLLGPRLTAGITKRGTAAHERLAAVAGRLEALSPVAVIARGYAVARDGHGQVVRNLGMAPPGSAVSVRVEDGWLYTEVQRHRPMQLRDGI
jgi:exodeoxyribonuclease VII large subunit